MAERAAPDETSAVIVPASSPAGVASLGGGSQASAPAGLADADREGAPSPSYADAPDVAATDRHALPARLSLLDLAPPAPLPHR